MDYLKRGLRRTFASIKDHKILFGIVFLLQLLFLVSFLSVAIYYQVKLLEDASGIIEPLEKANYNAEMIQEGAPFTEDYLRVFNSYNSMVQNLKEFVIALLLLFFFVNGAIWMLSHWLLEEKIHWKQKPKKACQFFLKMAASAAALLVPFLIPSYYLLSRFIRISGSFSKVVLAIEILLGAGAVLYYLFIVSLAAADIASWKRFARRWLDLSFRKIAKTAPALLLVALAFFLSSLLLYAAINYGRSFLLLAAAGIAEISVLVLTRIFFIACLQEIGHETDNH